MERSVKKIHGKEGKHRNFPIFIEYKLGLSFAKLMLSLTRWLDMPFLLSPGWSIFNVLNCEV